MTYELVGVTTEDGVRLEGSLLRPDATANALGADAVILHHGFGNNFYGPGFMGRLQARIAAAGCAALRVNSRGHDLAFAGPNGRLGGAYEIVGDCRYDWRAWIDLAGSLGFGRVALWGHSLGALKTALYLAGANDQRVPWAILSSPPHLSYTAWSAARSPCICATRRRPWSTGAKRTISCP